MQKIAFFRRLLRIYPRLLRLKELGSRFICFQETDRLSDSHGFTSNLRSLMTTDWVSVTKTEAQLGMAQIAQERCVSQDYRTLFIHQG